MKYINYVIILGITVLSFTAINCSKDTTKKDTPTDKTKVTDSVKAPVVNVDEIVTKISTFRAAGERKMNEKSLTKKEVILKDSKATEDTKQKWEKVEGYFDGGKLLRLQVYPHKGISTRTEEFYIMDGKMVFAFIQDGEKHEGQDMGEPGKEFYFDNDKLVKYVNSSGEKAADEVAEKKMYESKLPVEVKELIEIINTAK
jgi:hypothetical protein